MRADEAHSFSILQHYAVSLTVLSLSFHKHLFAQQMAFSLCRKQALERHITLEQWHLQIGSKLPIDIKLPKMLVSNSWHMVFFLAHAHLDARCMCRIQSLVCMLCIDK